ncbi:hypothetical protein TNIN_485481 [Trichonephila inaurata madagascariensis]|uniref:Uncharacterized protein n=1 Tax=Trichonephila inaurata madagascariensis TaxID=2747483 RepID=A0A8X7CFP5_9ARAC|nr:hypothetical protein TNIN_485481 [Trichonephila inaurata madagascariensis]
MPSRLKLHSSGNSTCMASLVAQSIVGGTIVKNGHVADGWLLSRRAHAAHDRVEGLRLPTPPKPSCGHFRGDGYSLSHLRFPRINQHVLQFPGVLALLVRLVCIPRQTNRFL